MSNRKTHIYVVSDGSLYYVGKADNPKKRYQEHWSQAFDDNRAAYGYKVSKWIRGLTQKPTMTILETVNYEDWPEAEIRWIALYRETYGHAYVLNKNSGGNDPSAENNPNTKLNWADIQEIRSSSESIKKLSKRYGIQKSGISKILRNKSWYDPNYDPNLRDNLSGENNGNSRLTAEDVRYIRLTYKPYSLGKTSKAFLGSKFGISHSLIDKIVRNINWHDPNWDPKTRTYLK